MTVIKSKIKKDTLLCMDARKNHRLTSASTPQLLAEEPQLLPDYSLALRSPQSIWEPARADCAKVQGVMTLPHVASLAFSWLLGGLALGFAYDAVLPPATCHLLLLAAAFVAYVNVYCSQHLCTLAG